MRVALALVALLAAPASAGPCLVPGLVPLVKTPGGATIDQFGGVVVVAVAFQGGVSKDPVVQPWEFVEGKRRKKARVTLLAPGLAVYAPNAPDKELDLEDTPGHSAVRVKFQFTNTDDMPVDAAPRPTAIVQAKQRPMFRTGSVVATLAEAPPAGTIAVLVRASGSTAKAARSWQEVRDPKSTRVEIYMRDRCEPEIPGTVATKAGDKVELAWVDSEGHVSLWSQAIEVKGEK